MRLTEEGSKKYVNNYANKNKYMEVVVEVGGGGYTCLVIYTGKFSLQQNGWPSKIREQSRNLQLYS